MQNHRLVRMQHMQNRTQLSAYILALCTFFIFSAGCNGKISESSFGSLDVPTPAAPPQTPVLPGTSNGLLDDAKYFYVGVDTSVGAIAHVHSTAGFNSNCGISKNSASNEDIICLVEVPEADLYIKDLELKFNAPPTMCRYLDRRPYWFYNHEVGQGPSVIRAQIDNVYNASGDLTGTTYLCDIDGNGTPTAPECNAHPEASPKNLTPTSAEFSCVYDRTAAGGANCCFGSYSLTTTITKTTPPGPTVADPATVTVNSWGGDYATCIGGPGKTNWTNTSGGIPNNIISYTEAGITDKQIITSAASLNLGSNIHAANYYGGAGGVAGSADHTHTGFLANPASSDRSYFVAPINDRSGSSISSTQDSFEFQCLDAAYEIKHRIRVYVREWDTYPDYLAYVSSQGVTAVPDRGTMDEPGTNCNAIPYVGYECDDFYDIDDFLNINLTGIALPGPPRAYDMTDINKRGSYFPNLGY